MKDYYEFEGDKYIIKDRRGSRMIPQQTRSMKSKNQFNTSDGERTPFRRKETVTFKLIVQCVLAAAAWGAFIYGLIKLKGY
jgi:hypothetical protein